MQDNDHARSVKSATHGNVAMADAQLSVGTSIGDSSGQKGRTPRRGSPRGASCGWALPVSRVLSRPVVSRHLDGGSAGPSWLGRPFLCRTPLPTPGGLSSPAPDPTPRSPDQGRAPFLKRGLGGLLGLARGGVCRAPSVTRRAVRSYRTLSPLPDPGRTPAIGGLLSVALSLALSRLLSELCGRVGVTHHRVLSCPDFPPAGAGRADSRRAAVWRRLSGDCIGAGGPAVRGFW